MRVSGGECDSVQVEQRRPVGVRVAVVGADHGPRLEVPRGVPRQRHEVHVDAVQAEDALAPRGFEGRGHGAGVRAPTGFG